GWGGRVPAAVADYAPVGELLAGRGRRAVEDSASGQLAELTDLETAVRDPSGDDHARRLGVHPAGDREDVPPVDRAQPRDVPHEEKPRAEDPSLLTGALRELGSGDPSGETESVADPCARAGLAPDRLPLDAQPPKSRGRRVPRPTTARAS